jgi:phosphoadenosine phosphosulfate reductase
MSVPSLATEAPETRLTRLNADLAGRSAQDIIRAALSEFGRRLTYVSSFGAESAVMLGLIAEVDPEIPIIFIDTGMHFHQTLQYRDTLGARLALRDIRTFHPAREDVTDLDPRGQLNKTDPDACCDIRKVRPLAPALEGFDAWITGRKHFHGGGRLRLPAVELSPPRFKFNPLIDWTAEDIAAYLAERDLPPHPMVAEGYPSIGCWPCTMRPVDPTDVRSGRWVGLKKEECGMHLERQQRPRVF